jgi:hypothetical protein
MSEAPRMDDEEIAAACSKFITFERMHHLLQLLADSPAPSGASSLTRGKKVQEWFTSEALSAPGATLELDYGRTGCDVLSYGSGGLRMLAHLDEVSYLVDGLAASPGLWPVAPYCYHLAQAPAPARVVRFLSDGSWTATDRGEVVSLDGRFFFRCPPSLELNPGDRVCLASDLACDLETGRVTGSLDNAAGVAAAMLAGAVLTLLEVPFTLVLTDEEEGPSGASSQTISRGAARYFRQSEDAPLNVAIDIHGVPDRDLNRVQGHSVPWGASLAEFSSHGRGSVAPPQLYAAVSELLCQENASGGVVTRNLGGYVPRSDDVVAMTQTNRVLILGYPGINRHFDRGLPTANIHDLLHLARALVTLAVAVSYKHVAVDW